MYNKQDILNIIALGEGYYAEFKSSLPSKIREITEEICAFANASGGVILIGVNDRNKIVGTEINNAKRSALQNSVSEINPLVPLELYSVEIDTRTIWVIEVNSGNQKPYVFSSAIYIRQGSNTQKLTSVEEIRSFFQQSERIYFDESPCREFLLNTDIESDWIAEFKTMSGISKSIDITQVFNNLKLLTSNDFAKNGTVLFFGKNPEKFIPTANIRCIAFEGLNKSNIIDDKSFSGPLFQQYQYSMQWIKNKINIRYEIIGSGPRKELWEIPETALKEAIINSLAHRDYYDKGTCINIELYNDRIEISNPGGLSLAISPKEFGTKSHSRNPLVFGLFARIHMVEQVGSGISRMKDAMKFVNLPEPIFHTDGFFTVIFKKHPTNNTGEKTGEKTREKTREKILSLMKENTEITTVEMAKSIGISQKGIEYHLSKLRKDKTVERVGGDKGGKWIVKTPKQ